VKTAFAKGFVVNVGDCTLEEISEKQWDMAKEMIEDQAFSASVYYVDYKDRLTLTVVDHLLLDSKNEVFDLMVSVAPKSKCVGFISTAWQSTFRKDEKIPDSLADDPGRKEVLIQLYSDPTQYYQRSGEIVENKVTNEKFMHSADPHTQAIGKVIDLYNINKRVYH